MKPIACISILFVFLITGCCKTGKDPDGRPVRNPSPGKPAASGTGVAVPVVPERKEVKRHHAGSGKRVKIKSAQPEPVSELPGNPAPARPDTLLILKLNSLRAQQLEPDLNEPLTRSYLFSSAPQTPFPSMIERSTERFFGLRFDNDILDYTDRFYTNGILLEYICPAFSGSPLSKTLLPYWRKGVNYYGMSLAQNMYTPSETKVGGIHYGDRPYAAYLYLSAFKVTNDPVHLLRQRSELQLGVIGPASFGGVVQTWFHGAVPSNDEPLGWEYQIENDVLVNYVISYEKGIVSMPHLELNLASTGILGTVYTKATAGFHLRAGAMNPYFNDLGFSKRSVNRASGKRNVQYYAYLTATGTAVGYDATLQGGLFNHTSVYTIPSDSIARFIFNGSAGVVLSVGGIRLDVEQHFISPEYTGGLWHLWISTGLAFSF